MRIFDITVPVSDSVPVYDGDPRPRIDTVISLENGDAANVSAICCGVHTGTHVDAPSHFISGGRTSADLDLSKLVGACRVIEIAESIDEIGPDELGDISGIERVLFKTKNSSFWNDLSGDFRTDYTSFSPEAAQILADNSIKLVGIDYLSIEKFDSEDFLTHRILLEREIVILECLDLRGIEPGDYEMACLPLKYIGGKGDGSPARTILIKR
ncbi:MAG: cyclase family protein [Acidobacteria bacterium]|nr:cyclase family protein [Acidobacteriota bacterium]